MDRVRKEGLLLSHGETERQDADGRGCVGPQLSVPVGGEELNGEGGREKTHKRERGGEGDSRCSLSCLELKGKEGKEILAPPSERKVDVCAVRRPQLLVRTCRRTLGR